MLGERTHSTYVGCVIGVRTHNSKCVCGVRIQSACSGFAFRVCASGANLQSSKLSKRDLRVRTCCANTDKPNSSWIGGLRCGWGGNTSCTFITFIHFIHFSDFTPSIYLYNLYTLYITHTRENGKLGAPKGNRTKVGALFWARIPLGNQTARTHARLNETKRSESISQLKSSLPNLRCIHINNSRNHNAYRGCEMFAAVKRSLLITKSIGNWEECGWEAVAQILFVVALLWHRLPWYRYRGSQPPWFLWRWLR